MTRPVKIFRRVEVAVKDLASVGTLTTLGHLAALVETARELGAPDSAEARQIDLYTGARGSLLVAVEWEVDE